MWLGQTVSLSPEEAEPPPLLGLHAISLGLPAGRYGEGHGNLVSTAASSPEEEFAFVFWILRTHQFLQKQLPREQEARRWASSQLYTQMPIFSNAN